MTAKPASKWRERLASPLTWHMAGAAVLALATIGLGIRFALDWVATSGSSSDALHAKQVQLRSLDLETAPLRGLDKKVVLSKQQILDFYSKRIPPNFSSISTRIGELEVKSGVRLSRLQYSQGASTADLTEIRLNSGISGDYPQIMHFVNDLERDSNFFVIRQMQLTSQQGGLVNLRLEVSTWLRPADVPVAPPTAPANSTPSNQGSPQASQTSGKEGE